MNVEQALDLMRRYPDGSYIRCPFCQCKSAQHSPNCAIEIVAAALTRPEAGRIEKEIVVAAMERYRIWVEEHPEGPIAPGLDGGMRHQSGYDLTVLCAEYQRQLDEAGVSPQREPAR